MTTATKALWLARNRIVLTYQPNGQPLGVITGYEDHDTFIVEHVIVFPGAPPTTLRRLLKLGLATAWSQYQQVVLCLSDEYSRHPWETLVARLGFRPYAHEKGLQWYSAFRP